MTKTTREALRAILRVAEGIAPHGNVSERALVYAGRLARVHAIARDALADEDARLAEIAPTAYQCPLCGQRITDGKPCGCGARDHGAGNRAGITSHPDPTATDAYMDVEVNGAALVASPPPLLSASWHPARVLRAEWANENATQVYTFPDRGSPLYVNRARLRLPR